MKLGNSVEITLGVTDIDVSLEFYIKLGFAELIKDICSNSWALLCDGIILILLKQSSCPYIELDYFLEDIHNKLPLIKKKPSNVIINYENKNLLYKATFQDNNNFKINLFNNKPCHLVKPFGKSFSACGSFGEISIRTKDIASSVNLWSNFGFKVINNKNSTYTIISDGLINIGFYKQACLSSPSIIYYSKDMAFKIGELRKNGITISQEITNPDGSISNAMLESPDGHTFFLFDSYWYN